MSNNKQSSVEWLYKELTEILCDIQVSPVKAIAIYERLKQAKAMHKKEIIEAFDEGQEYEYQYHINSTPKFDSETYYNETYGGNNEQR